MELLKILSKEDKLTIQIAFLKMSGYNGYEIAEKTGLTQKAVNLRMVRLRKKLKNFFEAWSYSAFFLGYRANGEKRSPAAWKMNTSHAGTFPPEWAT